MPVGRDLDGRDIITRVITPDGCRAAAMEQVDLVIRASRGNVIAIRGNAHGQDIPTRGVTPAQGGC